MWISRNSGVMLMLSIFMPLPAHADESLQSLLQGASRNGVYVTPDENEVSRAEKLFARCFERCGDDDVIEGWKALGFEVMHAKHAGQPVLVVREQEGRKEGRGFYLFNLNTEDTRVLQAPHSFKDENTREILLHLLAEDTFRAAAWNTVPRHYEQDGKRVDADLAHLSGSYFLAFSRAFAHRFTSGLLIQIHGFTRGKRHSENGASADMIVSAGSKIPKAVVLRAGSCLKKSGLGTVRVYPADINELGATTNIIGKRLRDMGHDGFVHIEMSADLRLALLKDKTDRAKLLRCLE